MARLLDRLRPLAAPEDPRALAAMQADRARSARAWLVAGVVGAHAAALAALGAGGGPMLLVALATALAAMWMLVVGAAQAVLLVRAEPRRLGDWLGGSVLVALGLLTAPFAGMLAFAGGGIQRMLPFALVLVGVCVLVAGLRSGAPRREPRGALLSLAVALAAAAVVAIDGIVLVPLGLVPGLPLEQVHLALERAGEGHAVPLAATLAVAWALGAALLAIGLWASGTRSATGLGIMLGAATLILFGRVAAHGIMGWALADLGDLSGGLPHDAPLWLLTAALGATASWLVLGRPRAVEAGTP